MIRIPVSLLVFSGLLLAQLAQAQDLPDYAVTPVATSPSGLTRSILAEKSGAPGQSPLGVKLPQLPPVDRITAKKKVDDSAVPSPSLLDDTGRLTAQLPSWLLMAGVTFLPAALLMTTSYVRIQITLSLLRQALGSPSIPGNQVIMALSLLLTVLIMRPVGEMVYAKSVKPCLDGRISQTEAIRTGVEPVRKFMITQILNTGHGAYLEELAGYARDQEDRSKASGNSQPQSAVADDRSAIAPEDLPLHVVAPAFLLSELTTALLIGFAVYLPFLIVDLVVATILAAMGLWMMPPSLVSTPAKLILFVLADGWMLTAGALINGFAAA